MKKAFLLLTLLIIAVVQTFAQLDPAYSKRLDDVFDSVSNKFKLKGASVAIIVPGQGTWERAYGESHAGTPINKDMFMGIGSNTKTYYAVLMLKLQEQGKLDLDDTIGTWVQHPNIPGKITIRQLLNHTSGLYSFTSNNKMNDYILADFTRVWPIDSVLNLVEAPNAAPGGAWDYSNTNYTVAGLIIRAVTGKSVQAALRDEILTPMGLGNTYLFPQEMPGGVIPHAWSSNLTPTAEMEDLIVAHNYSHNAMFSLASSAGAIMATAKDNAMFWDKLMSGKIINAASMVEFETLVPIAPGQGYGLGVFKVSSFNGRTIVSHGGTNIGFINDNIHDKVSGVTITMLTNQDSIKNNELLGYWIAALHKVTIQYTDAENIVANSIGATLFPNPAKGKLYVKTEHDCETEIYAITGGLIKRQSIVKGQNEISLDNIAPGNYIVRLRDEKGNMQNELVQVTQ